MNAMEKKQMRKNTTIITSLSTHVHKIDCPLFARLRRNSIIAQALCESRPDVGSSKNRSNCGYKEKVICQRYLRQNRTLALAASSTAIVVLFLCSTPSDPTIASANASSPHIVKHFSALKRDIMSLHTDRESF
jgi:hypothetical protein